MGKEVGAGHGAELHAGRPPLHFAFRSSEKLPSAEETAAIAKKSVGIERWLGVPSSQLNHCDRRRMECAMETGDSRESSIWTLFIVFGVIVMAGAGFAFFGVMSAQRTASFNQKTAVSARSAIMGAQNPKIVITVAQQQAATAGATGCSSPRLTTSSRSWGPESPEPRRAFAW